MTEAIAVEDARSFKELKKERLYAERIKIHPKAIAGRFRTIKWAVLIVLLGIYYVVPWIRWDRGAGVPDQAVLIDMPSRRAYFFWIEIWPQEVYYLTFLLILGAFGLFLATSLAGRVWCGFTCPQTVWTDLFMWVERLIEGDRGARIRLERAPLTRDKLVKKAAKHAAWLAIAAATGGAWIMYFNDAPTVTRAILTGNASLAVYFFFGLFTATTYLLAGFAREQVCTYMCPWPRFQAALLDEHSYVVTYQKWRGEPRAPLKKSQDWSSCGDCIACNQCVAVCPMGIDIRDGLQLECIGCGLCIDACNHVMARIGRPSELITLDTEHNQARRAQGLAPVHRFVRPRTMIYAAILLLLGSGVLLGLGFRSSVDAEVLHDRNPLFVTLSDGSIQNGFTIKILNKAREPRTFHLALEGLKGARLKGSGEDTDPAILGADPDSVTTHRIYIRVPRAALRGENASVWLELTEQATGQTTRHETVFWGPG
jgi:cytochrome c oxidase accessory protein FixG